MARHEGKLQKHINKLKDRIARDPKTFRVYTILRTLVIVSLIMSLVLGNYESAAICVLSLFLFLLPAFFEKQLKIEIPPLFEKIIYIFIFSSEILGEVDRFYTAIPGWDTMLHTMNGFLCAAIGFSIVDMFNRHSEDINLSPIYLAITAFCFSMTVGVLWEFVEFTGDQFFGLDMQKDFIVQNIASVTLDPTHSQVPYAVHNITRTIIETADGSQVVVEGGYLDIGILDTMKDLLVNFLGAVVCSVLCYFYVKKRDEGNIVGKLMIHTTSDEEVQEVNAYLDEREKQRAEKSHRNKRSKKQNDADAGTVG